MNIHPPPPRLDWAYLFDLDGTIAELTEDPETAAIEPGLLRMLAAVRDATGGAVAIVSGRALGTIDQLLRGLRLTSVGQHGAEWRDPDGREWRHGDPPEWLTPMGDMLAEFVARHDGLALERKGRTLALHYRAAPHLGSAVHRAVGEMAASTGAKICLQPGKRVLELLPCGVDKGVGVRTLMAARPFHGRLPVYLGDDASDEHAFAVVNEMQGWSIKVGLGATVARARLADVSAVHDWISEGEFAAEHPAVAS